MLRSELPWSYKRDSDGGIIPTLLVVISSHILISNSVKEHIWSYLELKTYSLNSSLLPSITSKMYDNK